MGKTAQRLNTTQPAVSRTIEELNLEDAIGVRLLDRSRPRGRADPWSRAAPLTQRQFLMICVIGEEYRVSQRSDARRDQDQRQNEAFIAGLLSTLPGRLRRRYPGITIHLKSGNPLSTSVGTCVPTIAIKNCGLRVVTLLLQL